MYYSRTYGMCPCVCVCVSGERMLGARSKENTFVLWFLARLGVPITLCKSKWGWRIRG